MDFVEDLKKDLQEYEKVYNEIRINSVFTNDETNFVYNEILSLREILNYLGED